MFLTGPEIRRQIVDEQGRKINIKPFNQKNINPNSYNLRLGEKLKVYEANLEWLRYRHNHKPRFFEVVTPEDQKMHGHNWLFDWEDKPFALDMKKKPEITEFNIPTEGMLLWPEILYLGQTFEWTDTVGFAPVIEGRSSIARLDVSIHQTAGFGDNGFQGRWTLEIKVGIPIWIYPDVPICQIAYHTVQGEELLYDGRYQNQEGAVESRLWLTEKPNGKVKANEKTTPENGSQSQNGKKKKKKTRRPTS